VPIVPAILLFLAYVEREEEEENNFHGETVGRVSSASQRVT